MSILKERKLFKYASKSHDLPKPHFQRFVVMQSYPTFPGPNSVRNLIPFKSLMEASGMQLQTHRFLEINIYKLRKHNLSTWIVTILTSETKRHISETNRKSLESPKQ